MEFALVAPIFFIMLFALIDFGRYVYYVQILNNAAREGARYAIVHGAKGIPSSGPPARERLVRPVGRERQVDGPQLPRGRHRPGHGVDDQPLLATPLDPPCNGGPSCPATTPAANIVDVTVDYQFRSVIPIVPIPPITVQGASTLVVNN